jgi:hypothetical protein
MDRYPHNDGVMRARKVVDEGKGKPRRVVECYCALGVLADIIATDRPPDLIAPGERFEWGGQRCPRRLYLSAAYELKATLQDKFGDGQQAFIAILPRELCRRLNVSMDTFDALVGVNDARGRAEVVLALTVMQAEGISLPNNPKAEEFRDVIQSATRPTQIEIFKGPNNAQ